MTFLRLNHTVDTFVVLLQAESFVQKELLARRVVAELLVRKLAVTKLLHGFPAEYLGWLYQSESESWSQSWY